MSNFEEIRRRAQDAAAVAGEKAEAVKLAAKTGVAIAAERRSLEKSYQALGEWFAAQCGCDDVPEGVADILAAIRASQDKLELLRSMKSEHDANARELLDRGVDFFVGKAEALAARNRNNIGMMREALAALARRTADGLKEDDRIETFAEKAEELAGQAKTLAEDVVEAAAEFIDGENKGE